MLSHFHRFGWCVLDEALDPHVLASLVAQVEGELAAPGVYGADQERTVHQSILLGDASTWPSQRQRRTVECAPTGVGDHWEALAQTPVLREALDTIVGSGDWELTFNNAAEPDVRHWYFPVTFPEYDYRGAQKKHATRPGQHCSGGSGGGQAQADSAPAAAAPLATHTAVREPHKDEWRRPNFLCCGDEDCVAPGRWQPVSRRRVRGKGWHIDSGPGFPEGALRTCEGSTYQGIVLLVLLTDCLPGGGGTCLIPGSHRWTQSKLEQHAEGLPHQDLNLWAVKTMTDLIDAGALELTNGAVDLDAAAVTGAVRLAESPPGNALGSGSQRCPQDQVVAPQVVGKAGSIVLMHPWLIHCGTTNLRSAPRLLGNGMVRITAAGYANGAWERINGEAVGGATLAMQPV